MFIVSVALATPLYQLFDYCSDKPLKVGVRVRVSFAHRKLVGVVLATPDNSDYLDKLKPIETCLDETPIISQFMIDFLTWGANYYHHPIGEAVLSALPKNIRLGKPVVVKKNIKPAKQQASKITPNKAQQHQIDRVMKQVNTYQPFLLHGITGSGKTEVYIRLSKQVLAKGKQVLILVPEIGLTPQMVARFSHRLQTSIAVIHSQLNDSQKTDAYLLAQSNQVGLVLGTRSAIFTPFSNLGLIVIDEEHDSSFKQQSDWRYSARDLAFMRAKMSDIPLLLGSATPSLETLKNVISQKIQYLSLATRAGNASLPTVSLIDMNVQESILSGTLLRKMSQHLKNDKQVMLFINRRGYAPVFHCQNCDYQAKCDACSTRLILHRASYRLKCHHCGAQSMPPTQCPLCEKQQLMASGYGTQRLEEMLYAHFPNTQVLRIDKDTTGKKKSMQNFLDKIAKNEPCIIIGTQMLAKGHDFHHLAMVGVLDADASFFSLDFRATEHLAQLLMQVAGRAGRGSDKGEVYIQTKQVSHPIFNFIKQHNYIEYAKVLLKERQQAQLPPYGYQALICANAKQKADAMGFLTQLKELLRRFEIVSVELWGPAEAIIEKKSHYFYVNLYVSSLDRTALHQVLAQLNANINQLKGRSKVRWYIEVDPL